MGSNSNTHDFISRSVASISEFWICNFSGPRNKSGIRGSGGIVGGRKDERMETAGFEPPRKTRRPGEFLRTETSPDERLCGTWPWSTSNTRRADDLWIATPVESEADDIFRLADG